ncbi:MAG: C25 family cysteine peptidase, partial [candidate division WOR-3 bacterium]
MNKLILTIIVPSIIVPLTLLIAHDGVTVTQSTLSKITLDISLPRLDIHVTEKNNSNFTELYFQGADRSAEVGAPQLPVIREFVEIPYDAEVTLNMEIVESEHLNLSYPVIPLQPPIPKSGPQPEFTMNSEIYSTDDYLLKERAKIEMIGEIRGHRIALVEIYPVSYNPKQNIIEYTPKLRIDLNLTGANILKTIEMRNRYYSLPYHLRLYDLVKNYDAYALTPPPDLPIGYLIIVPDEWMNNITPLVNWRTRKGYHVTVAPLSVVGGGSSTVVRNYIQNAYNNWSVPPTFVMLVGDVDKIGYFTGQGTGNPPTDLNYALMAGNDYWPDIDVFRASVANSAQLDSLVQKIIKYEQNDWISGTDWTNKAYFIASSDGGYHQVAENTHRYCMAIVRRRGMIADSLFLYYNSGTPITTALNSGRSWCTYSGHGSENSWADPNFTSANVRQLTNLDKVPLVGTFACLSGNFASTSYPECFSETWIRVGYRGAIAHYASSVSSYWVEDDTLQRRVFDYAFDSNYVWAMGMLNKAKIRYFAQMGNTSTTRRYFEMYNMMGDGAIDVYSNTPRTITVNYPSVIPLGFYNIPVTVTANGSPVRYALVCAMVKSDTSRRAVGYTDINGHVTLPITTTVPDSVYITVTGHNLRTHMGGLMVLATSGAYVMYLRHDVYDPGPGGNGNGNINPGEAVELRVWLKNYGSVAANNV